MFSQMLLRVFVTVTGLENSFPKGCGLAVAMCFPVQHTALIHAKGFLALWTAYLPQDIPQERFAFRDDA